MLGGFGMSGSFVSLHLASLFLLFVGGETSSGSPSKALGQSESFVNYVC